MKFFILNTLYIYVYVNPSQLNFFVSEFMDQISIKHTATECIFLGGGVGWLHKYIYVNYQVR